MLSEQGSIGMGILRKYKERLRRSVKRGLRDNTCNVGITQKRVQLVRDRHDRQTVRSESIWVGLHPRRQTGERKSPTVPLIRANHPSTRIKYQKSPKQQPTATRHKSSVMIMLLRYGRRKEQNRTKGRNHRTHLPPIHHPSQRIPQNPHLPHHPPNHPPTKIFQRVLRHSPRGIRQNRRLYNKSVVE